MILSSSPIKSLFGFIILISPVLMVLMCITVNEHSTWSVRKSRIIIFFTVNTFYFNVSPLLMAESTGHLGVWFFSFVWEWFNRFHIRCSITSSINQWLFLTIIRLELSPCLCCISWNDLVDYVFVQRTLW